MRTASKTGSTNTTLTCFALQETKTKDETFPFDLFEFMGYEVAHFGLNQWNGVAIAPELASKTCSAAR